MAALLSFPDSDDKANRRARAALGMSAGSVDGYVQLVDRLCLSFPVRQMCEESGDWKRRLHLWADGANRLLFEIARRPVQLRADTLLLDRLLKLKGLVSEAEAECLSDMRSPRGGAPADCLGMARAVNDAMRGCLESSAPGARRAPVAALTPDLLGDLLSNPFAGAVSSAGSSAAGAAVTPSAGHGPAAADLVGDLDSGNLRLPASPPAAGSVKRPGGAECPSGRFIARGPARPKGRGRAGDASRKWGWLIGVFHVLKMRLLRRAVSEKENRGFSGRPEVRS